MRIVVASDKWRGTFTSAEVGEAIAAGVRAVRPDAEVVIVPLADGGDGTLDVVLEAVPGERRFATVSGPLGAPVEAAWAMLPDGRALIESAQVVGLRHIPAGRRDPMAASSRGVGELLRQVLEVDCRRVILALGGSATVDGGAGMAGSLGYRLLNAAGEPLGEGGGALAELAAIDAGGRDPRLDGLEVEIWCDVANPLLGPRGAARTFGPQKGAGESEVERLEAGLARLARRLERDLGADVVDLPGAGAAGGLGAGAAAFLRGRMASGAGRVLATVGFEKILAGADLVITGEGRHDPDSMPGKLPDAVLARAAAHDTPAAVLCGELQREEEAVVGPRVYSRRDLRAAPEHLGAQEVAALASRLVVDLLEPIS